MLPAGTRPKLSVATYLADSHLGPETVPSDLIGTSEGLSMTGKENMTTALITFAVISLPQVKWVSSLKDTIGDPMAR